MNRKEIHRCWAPDGEPWSRWVKPVLFASLDENPIGGDRAAPPARDPSWIRRRVVEPLAAADPIDTEPHPYRETARLRDAAVVIDLPGAESARLGLELVEYGFRPIPLFNALPASAVASDVAAIVDVRPIMDVLVDGAEHVARVAMGAPPAFLLDADRSGEGRAIVPGLFDNRSVCMPSDFPSPETIGRAGIRRVVVITNEIASDVEPILFEWQRRGLVLWRAAAVDERPAARFVLARRWWPTRLVASVRRALIRPRADGSYGKLVMESSSG